MTVVCVRMAVKSWLTEQREDQLETWTLTYRTSALVSLTHTDPPSTLTGTFVLQAHSDAQLCLQDGTVTHEIVLAVVALQLRNSPITEWTPTLFPDIGEHDRSRLWVLFPFLSRSW
jgi:hypothetical protein